MAAHRKPTAQQAAMFQPTSKRMPEGYYSGDQPNPNLRAFVESHIRVRPYDAENDTYGIPAFDLPIEATKATAIYNMHTYWSKKPHDAIRQYIEHYSQPGDLVLDPFCGSGGTALAALMAGRKAVAIDRSPAATFITKNYCTPIDAQALQQAFGKLKEKVQAEIDWLYETRCDRCGGKAVTAYTVYSQVFQCPRCLEKVALFDCIQVKGQTLQGKPKKVNVCPHCYKLGHEEVIRSQSKKFGAVPVMSSYLCETGCKPARAERRHNDPHPQKRQFFERYDLGKLHEIEQKPIPHWYPTEYDMTGFSRYQRDALYYYDVKEVSDLFIKRNLWALAAIQSGIAQLVAARTVKDSLLFALNAVLLNCSRMYRYRPSLKGGLQNGTYYIPQESQIINVWRAFADKVDDLVRVAPSLVFSREILITTQSATDLSVIPSNAVDYIFTDPPYAEKVQYGELNFIWEAWLGFDTHWHDEEVIVNNARGKTEDDWASMMKQAMAESYRVLKPGRWLSLCYHDTSEGTWALVQDIMAEVGFLVDTSETALFIDTGQKSYNQLTADKVNKRDLVINFRKPRLGEAALTITINGDEDELSFGEKVRSTIRDYLTTHPWATKDRIYDQVVSRMVRAGQMQPHNFEELLRQVAEPADSEGGLGLRETTDRWYLKETALAVADAAESAREDVAAQQVGVFLARRLSELRRQQPEIAGVHYSDVFEYYVYALKDKPRRPLADWLLDYFYKTEAGTYRLPADEDEATVKAQIRTAGTNRRVRRYLAYLQQGLTIPERERPSSATLADWIRQCKRSGLYAEGKLLYEQGGLDFDDLTDAQSVEVDEDYQVCVRMLGRAVDARDKGKRGAAEKGSQGGKSSAFQTTFDL